MAGIIGPGLKFVIALWVLFCLVEVAVRAAGNGT